MADDLSISNPTPRKLPGPQLLHDLVPQDGLDGAAAIEHTAADGTWSSLDYGQLHRRAGLLARCITAALKPLDTSINRLIIPILIPQCTELYISQLAVLKSGGAFCPIVLDVPDERLRFILQDVDARVLLTISTLCPKLPDLEGVQIIKVDDHDTNVDGPEQAQTVTPRDLAYIMYTSGSTGQPKGVLLSHAAATQALLAHERHMPHFSRFLQFASPTFDVSVFEIFFTWFRRATIVTCDRRRLLNDLPAAINDLKIDACELTPSVASSLLRHRSRIPSLKVLLTIGEMLKPSVVEQFGGTAEKPAILHGMYGPTEATIHCTLQTNFPQDMSCGSIGIPLDTVSAFIVRALDENLKIDSTLEILPKGEEGELAIGGYQLADGYLNRDEQTRAVFVQHQEHGLLYRTGDRAKMLPDGRLECLGRISSGQVKLRGQRIELGEIEHIALRTPGCRDVVAEVISGILVAFCIRDDASVTKNSVLETCRTWLPAFMVPGDVMLMEGLPYLASGKCDRAILRARYQAQQLSVEETENKYGDRDMQILQTIGHILHTEVGPSSSLPGLGLDSLSAIRLASALRRAGFPQLDAAQILAARSPAAITDLLQDPVSSATSNDWQDVVDKSYRESLDMEFAECFTSELLEEVETSFPCTPIQAAMLSETKKNPQTYCNWVELLISGLHNLEQVRSSLQRLSDVHPLLRSGFVATTGKQFSFATVVWKSLLPGQIIETFSFENDFRLESDEQLLRPCRWQLMRTENGIHVLLTLHHALFDQWAIDILEADLSTLLKGGECQRPESFKAVSDYHFRYREDGISPDAIDFWQDHLHKASPTSLPLLRGQHAEKRLQSTPWRDLAIPTSRLGKFSQDLGCSSSSLFQAVLSYILGSYTGTTDVTFGSVFSGRTIPVNGIDTIFGPCLTTLPLRIDYSMAKTCKDLLNVVTDRNRAMQEHVLTPPTAIREAAGIAPGVALFDVVFVWQETTLDKKTTNRSVRLISSQDQLEFNLVLELEPSPTNIKIRATYQQSIISSEQVDLLVRQFNSMANVILDTPESLVENLGKTTATDLLSVSNPQPACYATKFELTSRIETQALRDPLATAVLFAKSLEGEKPSMERVSYSELNSRANRIAHAFIEYGVRPQSLVCICMEKCAELYVAILATFKAGAGYLPLTPDTPPARVKSILSQAAIRFCVCNSDTAETMSEVTDITSIDLSSQNLSRFSANPPKVKQVGSAVAYAVFTSGSTGEPKGVAVTMDNLKSNLEVLRELYAANPGDRLLQSCSQAFDVSVFEICFAFYTGMCICSATKEAMFRDFEHSIRTFNATHLSLTPTVAALVTPENIPSVKFLVTAGEGITEKVHQLWAGRGLHQGYGPSETTNICSVKMNLSPNDVLGNIGPVFKNTSAFVLSPSEDMTILPAGAYGEFAFGGEQVFQGYIGREDLNSAKIINHPQYGRIYRSGDMGRILADGTLLISGRLDDQIKIRGNRVELGEINTIVTGASQVYDCTTLVLGEGSSKHILITFWVPVGQPETTSPGVSVVQSDPGTISNLFDRLEDALPAYMIPNMLVPLTRLPMTAQGKLDRRLLREIIQSLDNTMRDSLSRSQEVASEDSPASTEEKVMAETVAATLEMPTSNISRHSSFFALGLNSLNAIKLASQLQRRLGVPIGVGDVLRHSSIARLSRMSSQKTDQRAIRGVKSDGIFPSKFTEQTIAAFTERGREVEAVLPCTPLQQAMLSESAKSSAVYCNTTKINFAGDMQKLQCVWNIMSERHAILRTCFVEAPLADHPYAQIVLKEPSQQWHCVKGVNTNGHVNADANGHANGHMNRHWNGPTDGHVTHRPELPPVTHASPIRIDEYKDAIYIQMHHAIYDGVAMSNLFADIRSAYAGEILHPATSFKPFLEEVTSQNGQNALDFWAARIRNFEPHPIPTLAQTSERYEQTLNHVVAVDPSALGAFSERCTCTTLAVVQAAWVKTLACAQSLTDVCFGNVVSGRSVSIPDIDRLVAPCFNTVPVRTRLDNIKTNIDLIKSLHRDNLETVPFQLTATRKIQAYCKDPSTHLFDSLLLVQPPRSNAELWDVEEYDMGMRIPVVLEVTPESDVFDLQLHYLTEKVPEDLVAALADAFECSLISCLQYPANSISDFMGFDSSRIRNQLAPKEPSRAANAAQSDTPTADDSWNFVEDMVRQIFSDLAQVDPTRIAKNTSLYQIGLDSLNAVQVASRLRKMNVRIDAADVMQHQTPSLLATFLQSQDLELGDSVKTSIDLTGFDTKSRPAILDSLDIDETGVEAIRPCTSAQSGMLAQFLHSRGGYYLNHSLYEVPLEHSFADIRTAWAAVERKHQVLRMGFHTLQDASTPFAMVIYHPGTFLSRIFLPFDILNEISAEQKATDDVLAALHIPAWRVSLLDTPRGRQMCLSMHHALYDAESLQILLADFGRALRSEKLGASSDIDLVLSNQLQSAALYKQERKDFWKTVLQSARLLKFPNLTPTIVRDVQAHSVESSSSISLATVELFCRREGVTIQALGQTAWAKLLAGYLGEPGVTFGTIFSGSSSKLAESVPFPTISTIPVYCNTNNPALEVIKGMVTYNASAQRHRFAPLSDIQRFAGSAGQALFDTIFVYQKASRQPEDNFDWHSIRNSLENDYIVSMEMESPPSRKIEYRLTYNTGFVPDEHALLLIKQYDMILSNIVSGQFECEQDLLSFTPPKEPTIPCSVNLLHELLERGARDHPDKPALEFIHSFQDKADSRKTWTYRQVDDRSNQVAHLLQQHGVETGGVVAVCMTKSAEASFAFVGILKAGCAFLAMDPDLPLARRSFIAEDSRAQLIFVDPGKIDAEMQKVVQNIELTETALLDYPEFDVQVPTIETSSTSYCLYTSGTTGTPKGCELTHENAVQAMMSFQRLFSGHWTPSSRWLQFASYWFDVSVLEHFWSWSVGITVVGAPRDLVLEDLAGFIQQANITHIDLTPSLARLIAPEEVPSLCNHVFITGGEALKQEIINTWGPHRTICNGYGPTEATIGVTMNPFLGSDAKPSNIGPAFDNVGAYVFAPGTDELVLRGAVGELCVSGKLVGKGYLHRPDLTAKAFPYLEKYGVRVYRTGDLVRLLADGSVSFIGRADTQAKLRGQRLEVDEIDAVIKDACKSTSDVVSLVIKTGEGSRETLVSFIVDGGTRNRDVRIVNSHQSRQLVQLADEACRNRLPGYMVPTYIIPISRLPLTVNNKIDTKRLIALFSPLTTRELQQLKGSRSEDGLLNPTEQKITKVLSQFLDISIADLVPSSNVFSLGLSSISAINFTTLLKRSHFSSVTIATVMTNPTIKGLAQALSRDSGESEGEKRAIKQAQLSMSAFAQRYRSSVAKALSLDVINIEFLAPCTPLQEGLLIESMKSERRPYFNHFWYEIPTVNVGRLEAAIQQLYSSVPILRTAFVRTDQGFAQAVRRNIQLTVATITYEESEVEQYLLQRKSEWIAAADQEVRAPFEALIVRAGDRKVLVIHAHHALYDGISWDLMMMSLAKFYKLDENPDCGPSFFEALPYGPLSHRLDAKDFWQKWMGPTTFEPLEMRSEVSDAAQVSIRTHFHFAHKLEDVRRRLAVPHQALFQTAFAVALHQFSPKTQFYGVVLSGRFFGFSRAEEIMGPLFNTVPFVINLRKDDTWSEYLKRCQQANTAVLPFQHTSLRAIRKFSGRHPSDPIFDVLFVFQQRGSREEEMIFKPLEVQLSTEYSLAFEIELNDSGEFSVTAAAKHKFADEVSLQGLMKSFESALKCMMDNDEQRISGVFHVHNNTDVRVEHKGTQMVPQPDGVTDFIWTPEAHLLRDTIAQVVQCDPELVDQQTAIFTLGLDSIDAVKLASRLRRVGITLPVSKILQAQTIPRMLDLIDGADKHVSQIEAVTTLIGIERQLQNSRNSLDISVRDIIERIIPAAPGQEALLADMLRSDFRDYYNSDILRLREGVDVEKLKNAWQTVTDASPILRTSFAEIAEPDIEAVFAQIIHQPEPLSFDELDLATQVDLAGYLERVREAAKASITRLPPLRLAIVTIQSERYLVLSLAHAQYDGHSLALLHQDVSTAYHGDAVQGRPSYDLAIEAALTSVNEEALAFWRTALSGARVSYFSELQAQRDSITHRAERVAKVSAVSAQSFCKQLGISMQAFSQTSWALVLAHCIQQLEVLFGVVLSCRDSEEAQNVMFPMMNTVPVRVVLHGTVQEMLRYAQSLNSEMRAYQRTPLREIQKTSSDVLQSSKSGSNNGLFDTLFIFQNLGEAIHKGYMPLYESIEGDSSVDYSVALELEAAGNDLVIRVATKDYAVDESGTQNLLEKFDHVLSFLVNNPTKPIVDLSGDAASICNLHPFLLYDNLLSRQTTSVDANDEDDSNDYGDLSSLPAIRSVLARVSKIPESEVSLNSTIENIGIDSISAIKVAALLRKESIKLSVSELLKARTPRKMAEIVNTKSSSPTPDGVSARDVIVDSLAHLDLHTVLGRGGLVLDNVDTVSPTTAGQVYMLAMWKKTGGELFFPTFTYALKTDKALGNVKLAWNELVARNAILRTTFVSGDSKVPLLQAVLKSAPQSFFEDEGRQFNDVLTQPFVRMQASSHKDGFLLKLKIHHALYDAVSLPLLMHELQDILTGSQVPSLGIIFEDYVAVSLGERCLVSKKEFWTRYLRDVHPLSLRVPASGISRKTECFKPEAFDHWSALEKHARTAGVTTQAVLFAAYAKVYAAHATLEADQGEDVVFGIYVANRSHIHDLDRLAAPTLNLVPLLVRSLKQQSIIALAKEIDKDLRSIGSANNSTVSLEEVYQWTGIRVDSFLNFLKLPERSDCVADGSISHVEQEWEFERSRIREPTRPEGFEKLLGLVDFQPGDAYQHAVDVEVSLVGGKMSIGLFCLEGMVGLEEAQQIVEELRRELEALTE